MSSTGLSNARLSSPSMRQFVRQIPANALLKSTRKAFLFSYLYVVLPKVIKRLSTAVKKREDPRDVIQSIIKTLFKALHPLKFPMLVARMIATMNVLTPFIEKYSTHAKATTSIHAHHNITSTVIASFLGALINFHSFQRHIIKYNRYFSLDFTLILVTRALDTVISSQFPRILGSGATGALLLNYGDGLLFTVSCFFIMHYWFFYPHKLPPAYARWITSAANVDQEIMTAFRGLKLGSLVYGDPDCPDAKAFEPMVERYGQPLEKALLVTNVPLSCEVLHAFSTPNCELHALWRFQRGFKFAFKLYGTINFIVWLIRRGNPKRLLFNSIRSLTFLGTFIAFYWYSLCLARTRLLPRLFPNTAITYWDNTIAPAAGAMGCGLSCFVENQQRRKELSLFVAPRALGTLVPSEPTKLNLRIERVVFALSFMTLASFAKQDPSKVRGIMGKGLGAIFKD